MKEEMIRLTEKLLTYNRMFLAIYKEGREKGVKQDFEMIIKPFVEKVSKTNAEWKEMLIKWLEQNPRKHIHVKQIFTTKDHIDTLSIQAFFPETSKSRFLNTNRTVDFFLLEVLKEFKE